MPGPAAPFSEQSFDAIALEIFWNRLIAIMNEVDDAIVRTSFSTIVGESRDFAYILTDAGGRSLCQSTYSPPNFCVVLPITAKHLLARFPVETLREGDVLVTNDPWLGTGHLPDFVMISPVVRNGRAIAFFGLIAANCRVPDLVLGDLKAMIGTHSIGIARLHELLDDYGLDDLEGFGGEIHRRSEAAMRERVGELQDGTYRFALEIDGYSERVRLQAAITISGDEVVVDYDGTSQADPTAAINCVYNTTYASTMFPFKCALAPEIPNNEALFRPFRVTAPEGCILNARFPAAVKTRAKVTNNLNQVIFGALWPLFGERAQAGSGSIWPFTLRGDEPPFGRYVVDMLPHGGRGAPRTLDGMAPVAFPHNSVVTPCEILESKAPILFLRKELRTDSGGAGRRRGGLGQTIAFRHVGSEEMILSIIPDKIFAAAPGLDGGCDGERGVVRLNGRAIERFPAIHFRPGDELELELPGGAGFGAPSGREPERVLEDVALGYVSPEQALRDYGIAPSPQGGARPAAG